jgi:CopG family transcriptional regulator / antitoxin EndoAI
MSNVTVNISFQGKLLDEIDAEAKRESRSRSELIREAARAYMQRQKRWTDAFALGDRIVRGKKLVEKDVIEAIRSVRKRTRNAA